MARSAPRRHHFTRHAKNKLRTYTGLDEAAISEILREEHNIAADSSGNARYRACRAGYRITVVVALDKPNLIITIYADKE